MQNNSNFAKIVLYVMLFPKDWALPGRHKGSKH
jgi:hypothetical protein